jgi:hypothetical protein
MCTTKLEHQKLPFLGDADDSTATTRKPHRESPGTRCLRLKYAAPKIDVLLLTNEILVHVQPTLMHVVCGSLVEIIHNLVHIHFRAVIRVIFANQSPALYRV